MTRLQLPSELLRYTAVAAVAFGVDVSLMSAMMVLLATHYLAASCISFAAGSVIAYLLCIKLVFQTRTIRNPTNEFLGFFVIGLIGLAVNAWALHTLVEQFNQHIAIAKAGAASTSFATNYLLRRITLFTDFRSTRVHAENPK